MADTPLRSARPRANTQQAATARESQQRINATERRFNQLMARLKTGGLAVLLAAGATAIAALTNAKLPIHGSPTPSTKDGEETKPAVPRQEDPWRGPALLARA
jgi:hypothetical protein